MIHKQNRLNLVLKNSMLQHMQFFHPKFLLVLHLFIVL